LAELFFSTFEKQLDAKRRIVVPLEFRALTAGPLDGVVCFPSVEADCIEAGGKALLDQHLALMDELEFGDPLRSALEFTVMGGMAQLSYDTAGRITLPENLCDLFGLTQDVVLVGLRDRFQIWERDAFQARRAAMRDLSREGVAAYRAQQRAAKLGAA